MNNKDLVLEQKPDEFIKKLKKDLDTWVEYLNDIVGALAFTLAVASLGTNHPEIIARISLAFIILIMLIRQSHFPRTLKELRRKKDKTDLEIIVQKGIEAHYFSVTTSIVNGAVYFVGIIALLIVAFGLHKHWL